MRERIYMETATHDIGFERDQRNNRVTHKIDPAIDGEREFVNQTLSGTGLVSARGWRVVGRKRSMFRGKRGAKFFGVAPSPPENGGVFHLKDC